MKRRSFLKAVSATSAGAVMGTGYWQAVEAAVGAGANTTMPQRTFKNDVKLSIVGFGGIVVVGQAQADANRDVARSVDRGVNYFDVAPSYGQGEAEDKLGIALEPYRNKAFLACKTQRRDAAGAREELEHSLKTLKTDHFDLYQLHAMSKMEDVDTVLGPGGALETFARARQEGKVKFLGFSAHNEDVALRLLDEFDFDSVLFPINYVCMAQGQFGPRLLAKAKEKNVARLALKALAYTPWASRQEKKAGHPKCWYQPISDVKQARQALRFTLSEDVTAAIPPGDERIYRMAETLAAQFTPLTQRERNALLKSSADLTPIFRA